MSFYGQQNTRRLQFIEYLRILITYINNLVSIKINRCDIILFIMVLHSEIVLIQYTSHVYLRVREHRIFIEHNVNITPVKICIILFFMLNLLRITTNYIINYQNNTF